MSHLTNLLDRLLPGRWQVEEPMPATRRLKLFSQVTPHDACLLAVRDLLGEIMEGNANAAFNIKADPAERLTACDYANFARQTLFQIENEITTARQRLEQLNEPATDTAPVRNHG